MTTRRKLLIAFIFSVTFQFAFTQTNNDVWYPIIKNGKMGYINKSGKIVAEPIYPRLHSYSMDNARGPFFIVRTKDDGVTIYKKKDKKILINEEFGSIYVDEKNKIIKVNEKNTDTSVFAFLDPVNYGYYNFDGSVMHPVKYKNALFSSSGYFNEGLAAFTEDNSYYGYIDVTGKTVIAPTYYNAEDFHNGFAVVTKSMYGLSGYIDKEGKPITDFIYSKAYSFDEKGFAIVILKDKDPASIINKYGTIVNEHLPYQPATNFFTKSEFENGLCLVYDSIAKKYGYIDYKGDVAIGLKYTVAQNFDNGSALVKADGKWTLINTEGKEIFAPIAAEMMYTFYNEGLIAVQKEKKGLWGFIDLKGNMVIEPAFKDMPYFKDGLAMLSTQSDVMDGNSNFQKIGYIDKTGKVIWPISE